MTTTQTPHQPDTDRRNKLLIAGGIAVVALAVLAFVVYWFVFRDDSAAGVDTQEAADARQEALADAQGEEPEAQPAADEAVGDDISGTWTVDTSIGTFDERCLTEVCDATFVGFRIDDEYLEDLKSVRDAVDYVHARLG